MNPHSALWIVTFTCLITIANILMWLSTRRTIQLQVASAQSLNYQSLIQSHRELMFGLISHPETLQAFALANGDIKHRLKFTHILSKGTRAETLADPREIFGKAIENGTSRLIIAHNHPSGDTTPSEADISLTETLLKGGKILNIPILDHIIVSKGGFSSLRQTNRYLWNIN